MTVAGILVCRTGTPEWELLWRGTGPAKVTCWVGWARSYFGKSSQGVWLGRIGLRGILGRHMVLIRLIEGDRNGACQHLPGRWKES